MTEPDREYWENEILLRSSGELPEERVPALEEAIAKDPELAELARFVDRDLAGASKAPRNFVGDAVMGEDTPLTPPAPMRWWPLGAAAALVFGGLLALLPRMVDDPDPGTGLAGSNPVRERLTVTAEISGRALELERQLAEAREVFRSGRYRRPATS